jgi:hypothetical protein
VSSHLCLKDDFSHVINAIYPQGSHQLKAITQDKLEMGSKEGSTEKRKNASHRKYGFKCLLMLFSIEDVIFILTMFWTTNTYLDSVLDNMDIMLFLDIVMFYFVDIKIFYH